MKKGDKSTPVQIRIRLEDLATIMEFVISSGYKPESAGKGMSAGVEMFASILVYNRLAKQYSLREAIDLLERLGLFTSLKIGKRVFTNWANDIKVSTLPPGTSQQEFQEILKKFEEIRSNSSECQVNDLTVPPQDDQLLAQLEEGIQTGKVPVAE